MFSLLAVKGKARLMLMIAWAFRGDGRKSHADAQDVWLKPGWGLLAGLKASPANAHDACRLPPKSRPADAHDVGRLVCNPNALHMMLVVMARWL